MLDPVLVLHLRNVYHLRVALPHHLHRLQKPYLHCRFCAQLLCRLPHQLRRLHIRPSWYNFALSEPPFLGSAWKGFLEILGELDILNENFLNLKLNYSYVHAPLLYIFINLFFDVVWYLLPFLEEILEDKLSTSIFEDGVGHFGNSCVGISHSVVRITGNDYLIVNGGINTDGNVVFRYDTLQS